MSYTSYDSEIYIIDKTLSNLLEDGKEWNGSFIKEINYKFVIDSSFLIIDIDYVKSEIFVKKNFFIKKMEDDYYETIITNYYNDGSYLIDKIIFDQIDSFINYVINL